MQLAVCILLLYFGLTQAQYCIYNRNFPIYLEKVLYTASPATSTGYKATKLNLLVTFNSAQNPSSHAFVLMGCKGPGGNYNEWSFEVTMTGVSSTSANLNIYPHATWGGIIFAHFGVVIMNQCGAGVELVYFSKDSITKHMFPQY